MSLIRQQRRPLASSLSTVVARPLPEPNARSMCFEKHPYPRRVTHEVSNNHDIHLSQSPDTRPQALRYSHASQRSSVAR